MDTKRTADLYVGHAKTFLSLSSVVVSLAAMSGFFKNESIDIGTTAIILICLFVLFFILSSLCFILTIKPEGWYEPFKRDWKSLDAIFYQKEYERTLQIISNKIATNERNEKTVLLRSRRFMTGLCFFVGLLIITLLLAFLPYFPFRSILP
ncbi:MAG: hypothetical protein AB9907_05565 [Flexilinea sp.]